MDNIRVLVLQILITSLFIFHTTKGANFEKTNGKLDVIPLKTSTTKKVEKPQPEANLGQIDQKYLVRPLKKKVKRHVNRRSWSGYKGYSNPPYLVFNRKIGAYFPYYSFPSSSDNSVRRSGIRNVPRN